MEKKTSLDCILLFLNEMNRGHPIKQGIVMRRRLHRNSILLFS